MSFDPQVWGTVAEWVAGIATVLVAAVLGGIAVWQARRATDLQRHALVLQELATELQEADVGIPFLPSPSAE